jgi:hypothetical protein
LTDRRLIRPLQQATADRGGPNPADVLLIDREKLFRQTEPALMVMNLGSGRNKWWQIFLRLDVWLVALTALYTFLVLYTDAVTRIPGGYPKGTFWGNLVGLFVPIGPNNVLAFFYVGLASLSGSGAIAFVGALRFILAFVAALFVLIFGEFILQQFFLIRPIQKIVINLVILMTLTLIVDLITFGKWMSMMILLFAVGGPSPF